MYKRIKIHEQHNIDFKTNCHEDYFKTICAFAKSQSGAFFFRANIEKIITSSDNNLIFSFDKQKGKFATDHLVYTESMIVAAFPEETKNLPHGLVFSRSFFINCNFSR